MNKEDVFEYIKQEYGFTGEALAGTFRGQEISEARHIAIFLLMDKCGLSSGQVGKILNRDGSTARQAHTKIKGMILDGRLNLNIKTSHDTFAKQLQLNDVLDDAFEGVRVRLIKAFQDDPIGTLCKINEAIK